MLPIADRLLILANPFQLRDRVFISQPHHGDLDSNAHRTHCLEGWEMIKAIRCWESGRTADS